MRRKGFVLLLCMLTLCCIANGKNSLDLKNITSGTFRPQGVRGIVSMADGEHYTQMSPDRTKIIKYAFKTGEEVGTVFDVATARDCNLKQIDGYIFSPDESNILIQTETVGRYRRTFTAVYYIFDVKNNKLQPLSDGGPQEAPVFSPDGTMIAFARDNNIFLVKLLFGNSESQVTEDGKYNEVINGIPDWVYEEEFSMSSALEFSPDNTMLAFLRFEETQVPVFSLQYFAGQEPRIPNFDLYPGLYNYKYPKAGEKNSKVTVHSFDIKSRVTRQLNIPAEAEDYIPRIRFTKDATKLAVITLNRHQNRMDIYFADPRSTIAKLVLREESPYYIDDTALDEIKFYDNNFSLVSDRDGYNHLYWYTLGGNLVKQVTKGAFEVKKFIGWDKASDTFYYEANRESPVQRAVYKIDKKGKVTNLTAQPRGTGSGAFGSTLKYFISSYSDLDTPPLIEVKDNEGKTIRTLTDNRPLKEAIANYDLPVKELFSFTTSQGVSLNAWMIKPLGFSTAKKYPVIMYQYAGPGSQAAVDRWNIGGDGQGIGWDTYMATQGYLVVCIDGRGTGGRGAEFAKCTYLNLGIKEAQDQVEGAKYLGSLPYVDASRIGIWGWSYGGYNTLMSMSEGTPVFKAGVAVAPVTDWKYYDTVYAERYMRTPKENAEGYRASSAFTRAGKLNGKLLIVHGMTDDNVHVQNTLEYTECLVQADKQFDMQLYINRDHGIRGGNTTYHLFTKLTNFFKSNL